MNELHVSELWRFSVTCPKADEVFLVEDSERGSGHWLKMQPVGDGRWTLIRRMDAGHHRFHYFAKEGSTYFNCGDTDLFATPIPAGDRPAMAGGDVYARTA